MPSEQETRTVTLPISGKVAVIQEGDGYDDLRILKKNKLPYQTVPDYIAAAVQSLDGDENVRRDQILALFVPDQEFLSIEIFRLKYGDTFTFEMTCKCGEKCTQSFDLSKLTYTPPPDCAISSDPTLSEMLPRSQKMAVVGMFTGKKEQIVLDLMFAGTPDINQSDYLALRSLGGQTDFTYADVAALKPKDHQVIRKLRSKLICGYDTTLIATCPECGEKTSFNLLMHPNFLLPAA